MIARHRHQPPNDSFKFPNIAAQRLSSKAVERSNPGVQVSMFGGTGGGYGFTPLTQASAACEEALIAAGGAGVSDPKVQETFQALRALLERVEL